MPQVPPEHVGEPLTVEHAWPHPPQLLVLVEVFVSQPFELFASQLPYPALHATSVQVPVLQEAVAFVRLQV
jgi:hypothetical protein